MGPVQDVKGRYLRSLDELMRTPVQWTSSMMLLLAVGVQQLGVGWTNLKAFLRVLKR